MIHLIPVIIRPFFHKANSNYTLAPSDALLQNVKVEKYFILVTTWRLA